VITFGELAAHLERQAVAVEAEIAGLVRATAESGAEMAREMIGREQETVAVPTGYFARWAPLAVRTIDDKTKLGFGPPDYQPLLRSGQYRASISGTSIGLTGVVGSSDPVGVYHEFGTAEMPPRPVLGRAVAVSFEVLCDQLGRVAMRALKPPGA